MADDFDTFNKDSDDYTSDTTDSFDRAELEDVKAQIVSVLAHPEAQDGLYFRNFQDLHEEDERPPVEADQVTILDALMELIGEGRVKVEDEQKEVIFHLARN